MVLSESTQAMLSVFSVFSKVAKINRAEDRPPPPVVPIQDEANVQRRIEKAVARRQAQADLHSATASDFGWYLIHYLAKTLPCRWSDNDTIIVCSVVEITPPYKGCRMVQGQRDMGQVQRIRQEISLATTAFKAQQIAKATPPIPEPVPSRCDFCFDETAKLAVCAICKVAKYCSKECQREAWQRHHKKVCKR